MAWDAPGHYGVACKRDDCRDPANRSPFNSRPRFREALAEVVRAVRARVLVLSYNDEAWVSLDELVELCAPRGPVAVLEFDSARYVGARIGIHDPSGRRVGTGRAPAQRRVPAGERRPRRGRARGRRPGAAPARGVG